MAESGKTGHYKELAEKLRGMILKGAYLPDEKLPTERDLSDKFGTSRVTVRRALRLLEDERLVRRVQGSGTYVSPHPSKKIPLMIDYGRSMGEHAPGLTRRTMSLEAGKADSETAAELGIDAGDKILRAFRVDDNGESAVACDQVSMAWEFAGKIGREELDCVDFIAAWTRKMGFKVHHCDQVIEAVGAKGEVARALGVAEGAPVLKSKETYFADEKTPAGVFSSYYNPEHICLSAKYKWS